MALLGNTDGNTERERELVDTMRGRQTDGFIPATSRRDHLLPVEEGVPTVLVNRRTDDGAVPWVGHVARSSTGPEPVAFADAFSEAAGLEATLRLLDAVPDLTAVVARQRLDRAGVLRGVGGEGLRVPALTTVRIPAAPAKRIVFPVELVTWYSTGPAKT
ncbi:hypothetical protein GCM10029964_081730 [Kibdelosporangium lantanae]